MFLDEGFASFHLRWVKKVDFGNFGDKVRLKFNGVIVGMVGGKLVMCLLREHICKLIAPSWYDWFG